MFTYRNLGCQYGLVSKIYLLKIDKGFPFRLVLASIGSPTHNFAKFLISILSFVNSGYQFTIKNSSELLLNISLIPLMLYLYLLTAFRFGIR